VIGLDLPDFLGVIAKTGANALTPGQISSPAPLGARQGSLATRKNGRLARIGLFSVKTFDKVSKRTERKKKDGQLPGVLSTTHLSQREQAEKESEQERRAWFRQTAKRKRKGGPGRGGVFHLARRHR
jgi:hypothetical protein